MPIRIPDYVVQDINSCCTGSKQAFRQSLYKKLIVTNNRTQLWIDSTNKQYSLSLSPVIVRAYIRGGYIEYEPKYCKNCGKLLDISKIAAGKCTCSMKCTKQLPESREKSSATSKKALSKIKSILLNRYGVSNPMHIASAKEKHKATCLKKYGSEFVFQTDEFKEKRHNTCLDRYGKAEPFSVDSIKDKAIKSAHKSRMNNYFPVFLKLLDSKHIKFLSTKEQYANEEDGLKFKCLDCGHEWTLNKSEQTYGYTAQHVYCPNCSKSFVSKKEQMLSDFIESIYSGPIIRNTRKILNGKELDIYIPEKKLAIEFNGNYWHNASRVNESEDKFYHQKKTLDCRKQGIRLIHIFEHEWDSKQDKVKALLKAALGVFDKKIYARQCSVKEISSTEYRQFLDINHFQGSVNSSIRYALVYENSIVAVIGFGKSRFDKNESSLELHRYCVKQSYNIVGGFSKLLAHSGIKSFVSYIDLAHYSGFGYNSIGCKEITITLPNYVYVKNAHLLTRMQCQKHRLHKILGSSYDSSLSESDNMALNGWLKLYDSGNLKVQYTAE